MSRSLPERVGQAYYSHGVLCAARPALVISFTAAIVILSCLPLVNLPLPSNIPQTFVENENVTDLPRWFPDPPIYIQQVIMKSTVSPWTSGMQLTDAIRGPLAEVFRLKETIQNYQEPKNRISLVDVCAHVEATSGNRPLPQYNCLLISPANFWDQDPMKFYTDASLAATVYEQYHTQVGKVSLAELLFGIGLRETGMKRYPLRNRQRVIQFAVTFLMTRLDRDYVEGLREHLFTLYPLLLDNITSSTLHIYYPGDFDFYEFLPLFCTYLALFIYMYFSVKKIELVRSKVGMAFSAVCTVIASLMMSIGLCLFFGLDPAASTRGREVFPYLVVVVGLENILVLTKSVLSTPEHLDSKIRLAQGLSKEGWGITKNLLTEVTILTFGLFTLVPSIQEFCIFAMVGLLCDFFLQMFFFSTVLSLDMAESTTDASLFGISQQESTRPLPRTRSTPRLEGRVPRRLRIMFFWGRTRIVQRGFMICMVVWIGGFLYSADLVKHLVQPSETYGKKLSNSGQLFGKYESFLGRESEHAILGNDSAQEAKHPEGGILRSVSNARPLDPVKWCYLVSAYNATSGPCRLAVLPPIRLSYAVSPSRVIGLRNPMEKPSPSFKWDKLALALDPSDETIDYEESAERQGWEAPYLPTSPLEVLLVTAASAISIIVISYAGLVVYKCVCSRHYADWRTQSWWTRAREQVVLDALSLPLEGKGHRVEALATDGNTLCCSYLSGEISIWDATSGEPIAHIDRNQYFSNLEDKEKEEKENIPDKESSVRNWERTVPDLRCLIDTKFTVRSRKKNEETLENRHSPSSGFDYGPVVQRLYEEAEAGESESDSDDEIFTNCPQIWCISSWDNIIAVGTSSGRVEFWDSTSGQFKTMYDDCSGIGITNIKVTSGRVILARMSGSLQILRFQWGNRFGQTPYRRFGGHVRAMSAGNVDDLGAPLLKVTPGAFLRVHQQPITVLEVESGRIVCGSHDHTLKVLNLMDELLVFTLHAHYGPITALFIDSVNPLTAGSGSQDGGLCVWDLLTGACVYSLCAHDGRIQALTYSPSYVISLGADEKLCIWDRFQGHLLNSVHLSQAYCTSLTMLTHNLLVTSQQGSLVVRDVRTGDPVRIVRLGNHDHFVSVTAIVRLRGSVACDYGDFVRIVKFPLVRDKAD